ncbi:uncharacterized protein [Lepeophtheirus salmonis]|uniref:Methyltransferase type 11 domain-containing protein n=1 Tax=Lepeophtheirus salmonis TaxID=72036 RepID=A0A0K2SXJ3_LEPSM|nr:uncharacterized protein LOC121123892 [Lepeophtheirus salmonis]
MESLQKGFLSLLNASNPSHHEPFLEWLRISLPDMIRTVSPAPAANTIKPVIRLQLREISNDIRAHLPLEAVMPSESIHHPDSEDFLHLDAFLYDEEDEEKLVEDGKLPKQICGDCGSKNTRQIKLITHSCSKDLLEYIFRNLLPLGLEGKTIVDVGSRLGAVLYGAYFFSNASKIIGIEMNPDLCVLQEQIINKYKLGNRVQVVRGEMTTLPEVFNSADVVILNNVFDWFMSPELQVKMWLFLRSVIKPGSLIVTVPSLQESLQHLPTGIVLETWVRQLNPALPMPHGIDEYEDEPIAKVQMYQVIQNTPLMG